MCAAHARTLRDFVEFHLKQKIPDNHPILAWMVDYAGTLITLFSKGKPHDGLTPFQMLKGKPWRFHRSARRWNTGVALRTSSKVDGDQGSIWAFVARRRNVSLEIRKAPGLSRVCVACQSKIGGTRNLL